MENNYQTLVLSEEALLTLIAFNRIYGIKIPQEDMDELKRAYQFIIDEKFLKSHQVNEVPLSKGFVASKI